MTVRGAVLGVASWRGIGAATELPFRTLGENV